MTTRKYSSRSQQTTLAAGITDTATSATVISGSGLLGGATVPAGTTFTVVIDPDTALEEIVDVTAVSTNVLTIVRGIENAGTGQAHSAGAAVRHMAIGRDFREANLHIEATGAYNDGTSTHTMHGIASGEGDIVGTLKTQTLTNKTLTAPTITNPSISGAGVDASIVFEGVTADAFETTLTVVDPTQDNTITMPNTTGTVVLATATQTLTNKTIDMTGVTLTGLSSAGMTVSSATPKNYVDSILGSATAASTSAASAATSAASAATSASSAVTSASSSLTSQTAAATSASSAAASATAAATSASSASTSASSAASSASSAYTSFLNADAAQELADANEAATYGMLLAAQTSASSAATSATSASVSATAAASSATSAEASDVSAQNWATQLGTPVAGGEYSAKYNAQLAATSATSAGTSATSAATSATSAAASAATAAAAVSAAFTSKGGILVGTGVGAYAVQAVGTNGQVLTANSAQADGVEWTTISGYSAPTIGSTSIASGATVTTIAGLTLTSPTINTPVITSPKISSTYSAKTAAYTFASGDEGSLFSMNNAASVQFNIPTDATFNFAVGTEFNVFWITGAGQPTIGAVTPGTTTVRSTGATSATPKLRVANSGATIKKIAANSWIVFGDIA